MKSKARNFAAAALFCLIFSAYSGAGNIPDVSKAQLAQRFAGISPDYSHLVIPANIAPLNFTIKEDGSEYFVRIYCDASAELSVRSSDGKVSIPETDWRKLLKAAAGKDIIYQIYARADGKWVRFMEFSNTVASEPIDRYLAYRNMHPVRRWLKTKISIRQRDLSGFDETLILDNSYNKGGCINCHTFRQNKTDSMLVATRSDVYGSGTILFKDGTAERIGEKFTYMSWHPSGRLVTYSFNMVTQFLHEVGHDAREVVDSDSTMGYYLVKEHRTKTVPQLSRKDRLETYPAWSPDGKYMYFCTAPKLWPGQTGWEKHYKDLRYDLVRISYDIDRDAWGEVETVISADEANGSCLLPRISPDGRWLLFCVADHGCFPVWNRTSDLYMLDLTTVAAGLKPRFLPLEINSDVSESSHCWSSNSRWIAFNSRRQDGKFTRIFISYVDENGRAHKAFVLPQEDPEFYESHMNIFSLPEFTIEPVKITGEALGKVMRGKKEIAVDMPITMATPSKGAEDINPDAWRTE